VVSIWETLYEVTLLHATLVVGDSAHFPLLVTSELYTSYSHLHPDEVQVKPDPSERALVFDVYQNSVAMVILFIVGKLSWSKQSEKMTKCILKIADFVSWQLKKLHEEMSKVSVKGILIPFILFIFLLLLFFVTSNVLMQHKRASKLSNVFQ